MCRPRNVMAARKVSGQASGRRGNATSFSTPQAVAEEALMEALARFDRAVSERVAAVQFADRKFVAEMVSIRGDLRATTATLSGLSVAA